MPPSQLGLLFPSFFMKFQALVKKMLGGFCCGVEVEGELIQRIIDIEIDTKSVAHDCPEDLSPLLEVLLLGDHRDALGGEDGVDAYLLQEVLGASAEDLAQLIDAQVVQLLELLPHLAQVLAQLLRCEELQEHGHVDVLAAPL